MREPIEEEKKQNEKPRRNLVDAMKELEMESKLGYNEKRSKCGRFNHSGGLGLSKRQKQIAVGVLKGYKVRRALNMNPEIKAMINQIRSLERIMDGLELQLELQRKKTIFIHTLHRQAKL